MSIDPAVEEAARAKKHKRIGSQSRCTCGHTGDGKNSDHKDLVSPGHGACKLCNCPKFIWAGFLGGIGENESWKSGANPMREGPRP
jgi:hypothetical protein